MTGTAQNITVTPIDSSNLVDRIRLCWGHLKDWEQLPIVKRSREWLETANASFSPTTFIAYVDETPAGMMEFVSQRLMTEVGLCPCRANPETSEVEKRYVLGKDFATWLFISCLWVGKDYQGRGVGKALLNRFLGSAILRSAHGALVYVTERDESWDRYIHWPAGPREFYLKAGFATLETLSAPAGHMLYRANAGAQPMRVPS